ncbi:hypothetical protein H5410_042200 [Solanum commersonii]|uniref:Uncharacterized protein n=1 Tax=Solanum commersonii TaxID=4109 RepID=A0A9J5XXT7_SOLCO|nr:hypothetical protein H5410_042200 [Solanum commersonii]
MSVKTLGIESVGSNMKIIPFSWSNEPRTSKLSVLPILVCYNPWILEFKCDFCQNFSWTSVNTLAIEPVGLDGETSPFED